MWNKQSKVHLFTMTEALIALVLTSTLLTILVATLRIYTSFFHNEKIQRDIDLTHFHSILEEKFISIPSPIHPQDKDYFFPCFLSQQSGEFIFSYNNKVHRNPLLSSTVLASLDLDDSHDLNLNTWPSPDLTKEDICESLCLLSNVSSVAYQFYNPKTNLWTEHWTCDQRSPPLMLAIEIKFMDKTSHHIHFHFPQVEQIVRVHQDA